MNAWGKSLDAEKKSGIRFLGDHDGSFTRALDVEFPAAPFLGTNRSKRYAITTLDGKVKSVNIEPDNLGTDGESSPFFPVPVRGGVGAGNYFSGLWNQKKRNIC
jgi:2-Cys peroxiredoxin 5